MARRIEEESTFAQGNQVAQGIKEMFGGRVSAHWTIRLDKEGTLLGGLHTSIDGVKAARNSLISGDNPQYGCDQVSLDYLKLGDMVSGEAGGKAVLHGIDDGTHGSVLNAAFDHPEVVTESE